MKNSKIWVWLVVSFCAEAFLIGMAWALPSWRFGLLVLSLLTSSWAQNRVLKATIAKVSSRPTAARHEDTYHTHVERTHGPMDALEIITKDRDDWKRLAAQAESKLSAMEQKAQEARENLAKQLVASSMTETLGPNTWPTRFRLAEMIRKGEI